MPPFARCLRDALARVRPALAALVLLGASGIASAAEPAEKPKTASFRFLRFSEVPELCVAGADGKYLAVEAHPGFFGKPLRLRTGGPIALFRRGEDGNPVKDRDKAAPPLGLLKPVDAPRQIVVLFANGDKVEPRAVADMPDRFPYGRALVINLTDAPLSAEIGGAVSKVPARGAGLCDAPAKVVGQNNIKVAFYASDAERKRFYSSVWVHDTKVRTLAFVFKNEAGQTLVRTIVDEYSPDFEEAAPEAPAKKTEPKK